MSSTIAAADSGLERSAARARAGLRRRLVVLFLVALGIRWAYALVTLAVVGQEGFKVGDSNGYLAMAAGYAKSIAAGDVSGWGWLGPDLTLMPLFTWSLTAHVAAAGAWAPLTYVLAQGVLDSGTCLLAFAMARALDERIALWAGYAAAATPTLVVLSGVIYTDTTFVFFASISIFASIRWLQARSWRWALVAGLGIGCAALVRVWIATWIAPLIILLALASLARRRLHGAQMLQLVSILAILAASLSPILLRNYSTFGVWSLTPQTGVHLAMWIAPLVREARDGIPRSETVAILEARFIERFGAEPQSNRFVQSARYRALAEEELRQLGAIAIAKAWLFGAAINIASPAITVVPAIATLPRKGFYDTPGRDFFEKATTFLFRSESALYGWLLMVGVAGVAVIRLLQITGGLILLFRLRDVWPLILLLGWIGYVLLINGQIASPKYRLPIEPVLAVLLGAALTRTRS